LKFSIVIPAFSTVIPVSPTVIPAKAGIHNQDQLKTEATKLIKYFLASLTIPEKDLWVNLSPYEKNRIVPESFGQTEMGRDLLAEDYMLKQITASLIYPEEEIGKKFWKRIYEESAKKFGTTNIPVNTFNKVWIVPEKAVVYENAKAGTAYVVESKLKVMLEQDYLALSHNVIRDFSTVIPAKAGIHDTSALGSQIVREIVIPELSKEVNEGQNFTQLRQVYNSLILATWYKKKIKDSILSQVYADKNKTAGVRYTSTVIPAKAGIQFKDDVEGLYKQYLQAFKKGAYNYIKEEIDPVTQQTLPRKYFSGGTSLQMSVFKETVDEASIVGLNTLNEVVIHAKIDAAMKVDGRVVRARRDKEYEILNEVPDGEKITVEQLTARLARHMDVTLKEVSDDVDQDEQLKGHTKLNFEEDIFSKSETTKARRDKELEILDGLSPGQKLTRSQLTARLNQIAEYANVPVWLVNLDTIRDGRLSTYPNLEVINNKEAIRARRDELLKILNGVEPDRKLTIGQLTAFLNKQAEYADVPVTKVNYDVVSDRRLKYHVRRERPVDVEVIKARRDKELEILNGVEQGKKLTETQLKERLNQVDGYANVVRSTVANDIASDERLSGHLNFEKSDKKTAKTRRNKLLEILSEVPEGEQLTISELTLRLNQEDGYVDVPVQTVRNDSNLDERLKGNAKLNIKVYKNNARIEKNGGIDLTSNKALSVQNNGQGIKFHIDPAQLAQLQNAPGFVPVIINIQPLKDLPAFLGLNVLKETN